MQFEAFVNELLKRAREAGFESAEAYLSSADSFEAEILGGAVIGYNVSSGIGLNFRGLIGGKIGYASTQVMDEDAISMLIEGARAGAEMIENEDKQFIFEGSPKYENINVYSAPLDQVAAAEKLELGKALEKATVSIDPRVTSVEESAVFSSSNEVTIVNTKGLNCSFKENGIGFYVVPIAKDKELINTAVRVVVRRSKDELNIEKAAAEAVQEAIDGLYAKPVPSGKYSVVLRHDAAASLLRTFASIFSADEAQKGLSLMKGREGEMVASACVSLLDDPFLESGMSSRPFDAEGVAAQKNALIEGGKLTTLLHNLKTAHKQGVQTTASAAKGSYASTISVAPSNLFFEPGEKTFDALLEQVGDGLLITSFEGMHAGANTVSGDFSLGAKGYKIEGGKRTSAVNQITVAGNFYTLLKDVLAAGSDLEFGFPGASAYGSPSLIIKELSIAGA